VNRWLATVALSGDHRGPIGSAVRLRLDDLTWQDLDGEIVVLDLQGSAYYQLNGSGALLWHRLLDGGDRADLEAALVERYEVDERQASNDVDAFITALTEARLLE
jgi:hypothetical protein